MLTSGCERIDAILFTHEHADHTAGLDDIRPFNFRFGDMPLFAHRRVLDNLTSRFAYIFETVDRYPGAPSVTVHEVSNNQPFSIAGKSVIPVDVLHGTLQVFGYRIDDFAYLTDVKTIAVEEKEKLRGLDVLVVNALREDPHHSHFNLEEALALVAELQPKRTYLTHISHTMGFHEDVQKTLPPNVYLAYDNLDLTI